MKMMMYIMWMMMLMMYIMWTMMLMIYLYNLDDDDEYVDDVDDIYNVDYR